MKLFYMNSTVKLNKNDEINRNYNTNLYSYFKYFWETNKQTLYKKKQTARSP